MTERAGERSEALIVKLTRNCRQPLRQAFFVARDRANHRAIAAGVIPARRIARAFNAFARGAIHAFRFASDREHSRTRQEADNGQNTGELPFHVTFSRFNGARE